MKFNYLWFAIPKTGKQVRVTIAYANNQYAFAVQSPNDMFVKYLGRELAIRKYNTGKVYYTQESTWKRIKESFLQLLISDKCLHNDIPDFLKAAFLLTR